ncbi:MAG: protein kinase [Planctomycetaceae bacterium]|jgi:serine/threonine-protein kinase|nr:protein kinase [Planctomycetaceae bacterium]
MAGRNVVIKLVPPEIRNAEMAMGQVRDTFLKVHAIQHQHICPVMGLIDDPDHGLYVVMKFINGKTLDVYRKDYIKQHGNFPASEAIQILWSVARALDYSHERKVLHRDVKPQNIMVSPEDGVQLIDFGLAAEIRSTMMNVSETPMDMAGTRPYMAPEQWRGRLQDAKTDQYALAVTAYELIAGHLPFQTQDVGVLRECALNDEAELIPNVAKHINAAIRKAMSKRRNDRFESCKAFVKAMAAKPKEPEAKTEVPLVVPPVTEPAFPAFPEPATSQPLRSEGVPIIDTSRKSSEYFSSKKFPYWMAGVGGLAAVLLFGIGWLLFHNPKPAASKSPTASEVQNASSVDKPAALKSPTASEVQNTSSVDKAASSPEKQTETVAPTPVPGIAKDDKKQDNVSSQPLSLPAPPQDLTRLSDEEKLFLQQKYPELNWTGANIIVVLDPEKTYDAVQKASKTKENDIIIVRTTKENHRTHNHPYINWKAKDFGSTAIVSLGQEKLVFDGKHLTDRICMADGSQVDFAGIVFTNAGLGKSAVGGWDHGSAVLAAGATVRLFDCAFIGNACAFTESNKQPPENMKKFWASYGGGALAAWGAVRSFCATSFSRETGTTILPISTGKYLRIKPFVGSVPAV